MKYAWLFIISLISSCYFQKPVTSFAKKNGLRAREISSITFFDGQLKIDTTLPAEKRKLYLLYNEQGDVKYLAEKLIVAHQLYKIQKHADSFYMLTKSGSGPRYFSEDTVLFYDDYVASHLCLYNSPPNSLDRRIAQSFFKTYHFKEDSIYILKLQKPEPLIFIHQYGNNKNASEQFVQQATLQKTTGSKQNFIWDFLFRQ